MTRRCAECGAEVSWVTVLPDGQMQCPRPDCGAINPPFYFPLVKPIQVPDD